MAPDSFKGTFDADAAAELIGAGVREVLPDAEITLAPMADGGEGTAARFTGETVTLPTTDAAGRLTEAAYVYDAAAATAYIDVAAASGLPAVADRPVPLTGDTYGTGVLIADARTRGAQRVVLALGGSGTVDGGSGILVALGARLLDRRGLPVPKGGGWLSAVESVDTARLNTDAGAMEFVLLTDVTAPVTGPEGAARVFGPQKGAAADDVELLDESLAHLCKVLEFDPTTPGAGAAGGVPVCLTWLARLLGNPDPRILPGAPVVAASLGLEDAVASADLVITGEGSLDAQSFTGKVVGTLAGLERAEGAHLAVVCGRADAAARGALPAGSLVEETGSKDADALRAAGARVAEAYRKISTVQG
ncbi:glycerate kinase [Corynebacterium frankenforstense DSM 45800]|uniref:Glycerate kinase n=1 Tax=Corynebacterium frankenforstense DSM 45800 TaxID=1437875 RepID=A0A1L7CTH0_9CORY|nr:glycerate kinase [Corynebacterium frankenforstense DSM 45800]